MNADIEPAAESHGHEALERKKTPGLLHNFARKNAAQEEKKMSAGAPHQENGCIDYVPAALAIPPMRARARKAVIVVGAVRVGGSNQEGEKKQELHADS